MLNLGIIQSQPTEHISQMPQNGVLFSDCVEADYLQFNSGAVAKIGLAEKEVHLIAA